MASRNRTNDVELQKLMVNKIHMLPTFPSNKQLDGKSYSTWAMQMQAVLKSYDLSTTILHEVNHAMIPFKGTYVEKAQAKQDQNI